MHFTKKEPLEEVEMVLRLCCYVKYKLYVTFIHTSMGILFNAFTQIITLYGGRGDRSGGGGRVVGSTIAPNNY